MRVVIHDYPGYAFPLSLGRELAQFGWEIHHLYSPDIAAPKGRFDPLGRSNHRLHPISVGRPLDKGNYLKRFIQEREYTAKLRAAIRDISPDVVLSGQCPVDMHLAALKEVHALGSAFVFWVQDLYGLAIEAYVPGLLGKLVGRYYKGLERRLAGLSEGTVVITSAFASHLGVSMRDPRVSEIPNWASLVDIVPGEKVNQWSSQRGLSATTNVIYTGTLGRKHDPSVLKALAVGLSDLPAQVVVVAHGPGADWLRIESNSIENLHVLPLQPYETLSDLYASADLLVAILEPEAAELSVPSKVLTYLCAGKPVLLSAPEHNQAAQLLTSVGCGSVVPPGDSARLIQTARDYLNDRTSSREAGRRGREYAEFAFDMDVIAPRFMAVLEAAARRRSHRRRW